jgi:eukaryotic-like serine/threonine-protein kinase
MFTLNKEANRDIMVMPLFGDRKMFAFAQSASNETQPALSPDDRWLAYVSDELGRSAGGGTSQAIFVQAFPDGGKKQQISTGAGGVQPRWRRDGKELLYLAFDGRLMAVAVTSSGDSVRFGPPQPLFHTTLPSSPGLGTRAEYDVTNDGQRFIVAESRGDTTGDTGPITVLVNWTAALKK